MKYTAMAGEGGASQATGKVPSEALSEANTRISGKAACKATSWVLIKVPVHGNQRCNQ